MKPERPATVALDDNSSSVSWRSWHGLPILLLILHALLAWLGRAPGIVTREDDARYLLLARALKAGTYREWWSPAGPLHHMYPPGYPALLAVWTAIGGEQFNWLIVLQILLSVGTLMLTFSAIRRLMPPIVALSGLCLAAINPDLLRWAGEVSSEVALAFCFALAIWAHSALAPGVQRTSIMMMAAFAAPFVRVAGVVLPLALVADWLWQRRVRFALVATCALALVIGPLLWWTLRDPGAVVGNSYAADFAFKPDAQVPFIVVFAKRLLANGLFYPAQALPSLIPLPTVPGTHIDNAIDAVLVGAGLGGGMFWAFGRLRLAVLTLVASAGLFLIWPWHDERFLLPFLPFIVVLFLFGLYRIGTRFSPRVASALVTVTSAVVIVVAVRGTQARIRERIHCDRGGAVPDATCISAEERGLFQGLRVVADSLPKNARVLTANAATLYLYTGRQGVRTLTVEMLDSAHFWRRLHDFGVDYILLGALHASEPRIALRLEERCTDLRLISTVAPHTYLFQVPSARDQSASMRGSASGSDPGGAVCSALQQYLQEERVGHWILAARTDAAALRRYASLR